MLVVKTHAFSEEKKAKNEIFNKAILLVRSPFDALKVCLDTILFVCRFSSERCQTPSSASYAFLPHPGPITPVKHVLYLHKAFTRSLNFRTSCTPTQKAMPLHFCFPVIEKSCFRT